MRATLDTVADPAAAAGPTALRVAAHHEGHTGAVKALLAAGADIDATNDHGATPLHYAAHQGHTEIVKSLLDAGADSTAATDDGITPLYIAAQSGRTESVEALLAAGADMDVTAGQYGVTPLAIAAHQAHTGVVKALLAAGADKQATACGLCCESACVGACGVRFESEVGVNRNEHAYSRIKECLAQCLSCAFHVPLPPMALLLLPTTPTSAVARSPNAADRTRAHGPYGS